MDENTSEPLGNVPHPAEGFGTVPQASESFRTVRNDAESFGTLPNHSESPVTVEPPAAKTENHTITVREAARAFERAGVARTERSIVNWCQLNRQGVSRLDCYFEENEHKYFITPQSVDRAIREELAKAREQGLPNASEPARSEPPREEREEPASTQHWPAQDASMETAGRLRELELENRDLLITTRAKDMFIEQLRHDREAFVAERQQLIDQLIASSRQIGELETKLLQIEAPRQRLERDPTVPPSADVPTHDAVPQPEPIVHEPQVEYPPSYN